MQLYRNCTLAWVFSCKFVAYFQNPFPKNTSGRLLLNQLTKHEKYEEKYEDLPEVSVKQLVIESSSISLGQIMCDVYVKAKLFASIKVSSVLFVLKKCYARPSLISFRLKRNNMSKSVSKRVFQVVSSQLFKEICTKSEKVSPCLSSKKNGMI